MSSRGNTSQRGELAEAVFIERAIRHGYIASKPFGNNSPYDVVIGGRSRGLKRVQVKSAWVLSATGIYSVSCEARNCGFYTAADIDILAAYVAPADAWYIIPVEAFSPRRHLNVQPHQPERDAWARYREAWWRLGRPCSAPQLFPRVLPPQIPPPPVGPGGLLIPGPGP